LRPTHPRFGAIGELCDENAGVSGQRNDPKAIRDEYQLQDVAIFDS
jgi:hypothetical protein